MTDAPADGSKTGNGTQGDGPKKPVIDAKTFAITLPDGAGHKGTLTVNDNAPIESIILAYEVVHKLAHHISDRVGQLNTTKLPVFFHNAADRSRQRVAVVRGPFR